MKSFFSFLMGILFIFLSLTSHSISTAQGGLTLIVNSAADTDDGRCDEANCTLREAINTSNQRLDTDPVAFTIGFNIDGGGLQTIKPTSALPTITQPLIIDGFTQPGYSGMPLIELDGSEAGEGVDALTITANESVVLGLIINRFDDDGLVLNANHSTYIARNFIGTDATGTLDRGNGDKGIQINNSGSNTIGGFDSQALNLISGNGGTGISIFGKEATRNRIRGNLIGTDLSGRSILGNEGNGIYINAPESIIGGIGEGQENVISGNMRNGIFIEGANGRQNQILGNFIGTNVEGSASLSNNGNGIYIIGSSNIVGGLANGARNIISGNSGAGIYIKGESSTNNKVFRNFIGTDVTGMAALPNHDGVLIKQASNNIIGGSKEGGNLISGNAGNGVLIAGRMGKSQLTTGNKIINNLIGMNARSSVALGNSFNGILIYSAESNQVGDEVGGNFISGNEGAGVVIEGGGRNKIYGNSIGRYSPNQGSGVFINDSDGNLIGDFREEAGNVISGNGGHGIHIRGDYENLDPAENNKILSNFIGRIHLEPFVEVGNAEDGILLDYAANTEIGFEEVKEYVPLNGSNIIAFNGRNGISVVRGIHPNTITSNIIHDNTGIGIDLGNDGPTANDENDEDSGPNQLQNYPVLMSVTQNQQQVITHWRLNSVPERSFRIEFFRNEDCHPSGSGEGVLFAFKRVITDENGTATFSVSSLLDDTVTTTATDVLGNTSEFSRCYPGPAHYHQLFLPFVER